MIEHVMFAFGESPLGMMCCVSAIYLVGYLIGRSN
jgi:hypothetical protein